MFRIYVGNLSFQTSEDAVRDLFSPFGEVKECSLVLDRDTGRSRGFAFVTMADATQGQAAIEALNGKDVDGRPLTVNEARPREPRSGGGGGFRGGRGGGGGYRNG